MTRVRGSSISRVGALLFAVLVVAGIAGANAGVFFYMTEGVKKCFIEEVPKDTLVLTRFKSKVLNPTPEQQEALGIKVTILDPFGQVAYQRNLGLEGRYAFTAQVGGEHQICLQTASARWFGQGAQLEVELDVETGVGATDYDEIARLESLGAMELDVRRLNDAVHEIIAEQIYQKKREAQFRDTSESTNTTVMWWSIAQSVLLMFSAFYQIRHLKHFFHQKKVV